MFGFGDSHDEVYGEKTHKSSWTHELIAGAAAFEAMKKHEESNPGTCHLLTILMSLKSVFHPYPSILMRLPCKILTMEYCLISNLP